MGTLDRGWVAGLFEGEGYIVNGIVMVGLTDRDVLERLARVTGGRLRGPYTYKAPARANCKPYYRWTLGKRASRELLTLIRPLLGRRRRAQVDAAMGGAEVRVG